jgi:hypothetical protein
VSIIVVASELRDDPQRRHVPGCTHAVRASGLVRRRCRRRLAATARRP